MYERTGLYSELFFVFSDFAMSFRRSPLLPSCILSDVIGRDQNKLSFIIF